MPVIRGMQSREYATRCTGGSEKSLVLNALVIYYLFHVCSNLWWYSADVSVAVNSFDRHEYLISSRIIEMFRRALADLTAILH